MFFLFSFSSFFLILQARECTCVNVKYLRKVQRLKVKLIFHFFLHFFLFRRFLFFFFLKFQHFPFSWLSFFKVIFFLFFFPWFFIFLIFFSSSFSSFFLCFAFLSLFYLLFTFSFFCYSPFPTRKHFFAIFITSFPFQLPHNMLFVSHSSIINTRISSFIIIWREIRVTIEIGRWKTVRYYPHFESLLTGLNHVIHSTF